MTYNGMGNRSSYAATGLYYASARWYNPAVGQFTSPDPTGDGSLVIWDAATGEKLVRFDRPNTGVCKTRPSVIFSVAFHPDGKVLAAGTEQGRCEIWNIVAKKRTQVISDARFWVRSIAFSPDGMLLAVGDERGPARLYVRMPSTGRTR
jgi:RHS repeat-associated protein